VRLRRTNPLVGIVTLPKYGLKLFSPPRDATRFGPSFRIPKPSHEPRVTASILPFPTITPPSCGLEALSLLLPGEMKVSFFFDWDGVLGGPRPWFSTKDVF